MRKVGNVVLVFLLFTFIFGIIGVQVVVCTSRRVHFYFQFVLAESLLLTIYILFVVVPTNVISSRLTSSSRANFGIAKGPRATSTFDCYIFRCFNTALPACISGQIIYSSNKGDANASSYICTNPIFARELKAIFSQIRLLLDFDNCTGNWTDIYTGETASRRWVNSVRLVPTHTYAIPASVCLMIPYDVSPRNHLITATIIAHVVHLFILIVPPAPRNWKACLSPRVDMLIYIYIYSYYSSHTLVYNHTYMFT